MSRRGRPPASRVEIESSAARLLSDILDRIDAGVTGRAVVPFVRPRALYHVFSKSGVYRLLAEGQLEGIKLAGRLLITVESIDRLLATAEPWRPRRTGKP